MLGGGLVPGSVTLLGGEPGIGKSTVLLQAAAEVAASGRTVLYITGEESPQQVRLRAERLGALHPLLYLAAESSVPNVVRSIDGVGPELVVVDSIQTLSVPELASAPGSVAQVRECSHRLVQEAKQRGCAVVLVGHVTKEGNLAVLGARTPGGYGAGLRRRPAPRCASCGWSSTTSDPPRNWVCSR